MLALLERRVGQISKHVVSDGSGLTGSFKLCCGAVFDAPVYGPLGVLAYLESLS